MARVAATFLALALKGAAAFKHLDTGSEQSQLDPNRILCPVLAALYNSGDLVVDEQGSSELLQIKSALANGTWCGETFADFQAAGIAAYTAEQKDKQEYRDRCVPLFTLKGTACFAQRQINPYVDSVKRWLNIFTMNGNEDVEHGYSTGTRGGATNVPDFDDGCNGVFPCEARFQKFYVAHADANGRLYLENILAIICHTLSEGDRGGEFSYNGGLPLYAPGLDSLDSKVPGRDWQIKAAMVGWLSAFGRTDEEGKLYFTVGDARAMLMEGRFPDGWQKRKWGTMSDFLHNANTELPCDGRTSWWQGTDCESFTGETCHLWCWAEGSTCISGKCVCGRGSNGIAMCAKDGKCEEREDKCIYFGQKCSRTSANNPGAPFLEAVGAVAV